jgi:hypothetical protein
MHFSKRGLPALFEPMYSWLASGSDGTKAYEWPMGEKRTSS